MTTELAQTGPTETTERAAPPAPLDQNPAAVYLRGLSQGSQRGMLAALNLTASMMTRGQRNAFTMPWAQLRFQHTSGLAAALSDKHSPAYAAKICAAVRGVLKAAWRLEQMSAEDYQRTIDFHLPRSSSGEVLHGRALEYDEINKLFQCLDYDNRPVARRNAALLAVMFTTGLRRSEVVALTVADLDMTSRTLRVEHGKGNKRREVPIADGAHKRLAEWLRLRGTWPGPVFVCLVDYNSDEFCQRGMTDQNVRVILKTLAKRAGVANFTPHDLRRSATTHMIEAGESLNAVRGVLGHSDIRMTAKYDRAGEGAKRKAVNSLLVPEKAVWIAPRVPESGDVYAEWQRTGTT